MCSAIPLTENMAIRNRAFAKYNGGGVTYTCKAGFSFNANDVNDTTRTVQCKANGVLGQLNPPDCTRKYLSLNNCTCSKSRPSRQEIYTVQ